MESSPHRSGAGIPLRIEIARGSFHFRGTVSLPVIPTRPPELVPLALALADAVADDAARRVAAEGGTVSCKKGCGTCCRYLVHVSESEAYYLHDLVERLPELRRSQLDSLSALNTHLHERVAKSTSARCYTGTCS